MDVTEFTRSRLSTETRFSTTTRGSRSSGTSSRASRRAAGGISSFETEGLPYFCRKYIYTTALKGRQIIFVGISETGGEENLIRWADSGFAPCARYDCALLVVFFVEGGRTMDGCRSHSYARKSLTVSIGCSLFCCLAGCAWRPTGEALPREFSSQTLVGLHRRRGTVEAG